jgi:uncharacterized protein GlcG (DUF336 family)
MSVAKLIAAVAISCVAIGAANAQTPLFEKNVSMKMALMIIEGALDQCTKDGHRVSVVVVDRAGNVAASVRGDGTKPHMLEFARLKAYTASTNPRGLTSLEFKNVANQAERAHLKEIPGIVFVGGGVPIKIGNQVIGGVGISGAPGEDKDEACANAGIAKVVDSLN